MPAPRPTLDVSPAQIFSDTWFILEGTAWPDCPVRLSIGKRSLGGHRVLIGFPHPDGVRPDAEGRFQVCVDLIGVRAGKHRVRAHAASTRRNRASAVVEVLAPPSRTDEQGIPKIGPLGRFADFGRSRFAAAGHVPAGLRRHQVEAVGRLRSAHGEAHGDKTPGEHTPALPVPGRCNWTPVGASPVGPLRGLQPPYSGRALTLVHDPSIARTLYLGTANGGVWKSTDDGDTWTPKTDHEVSLATAAIAIDPGDSRRVFAGTGEPAAGSPASYYGNGILRSADGGDSWVLRGTTEFERAKISTILFDPTDPTSQRLLVAASTGVFESPDGGDNWTLLRAGSATALAAYVDPARPTELRLVAGFAPGGVYTAVWNGSTWTPLTRVFDPAIPVEIFWGIAFAPRAGPDSPIYVLFGGLGDFKGVAVTRDGGRTWGSIDVRLDQDVLGTGSVESGHSHTVSIPAADLTAPPVDRTYTTSGAGSPAHSHTLSLTAAEVRAVARGSLVFKSTDPDASGHSHRMRLESVRQVPYNLAIGVDPRDENTLYLGEIFLWRNRTGGGVFERVDTGSGPTPDGLPTHTHVDQHAIVPDPRTPGRVWLANDGGLFYSDDSGTAWKHRNRGLATLQYLHSSTHPRWTTVALGGTQDNGGHRHLGTPTWDWVFAGDAGFSAFDPRDPFRTYMGRLGTYFFRSDEAGARGSWRAANAGITGRALSYPPFLLDLHAARVCWFGTTRLWRSDDGAGRWSAATADLTGTVSALAGDPSAPDRVYVGTDQGRVYRVERTGPTWAPSDVTVSDLTGPDLPPGIGVSDLAADSAGTVWATLSLIWGAEGPGEFSSQHVYRLPTGSSRWEARTRGLVDANPINTIAIDPASDLRLFCGGDVGVFRTEDAGGTWIPWDQGLPNSPVFHLELHPASRLLRAATHGRSVWERPIDATTCSDVDLYVRDNLLDSGRVRPSPSNEDSPVARGRRVHWWQCEDVKVDAEESTGGAPPDYQTVDPIGDYLELALLEHRTARRDRVNRFYAQVHNRGPFRATNVRARAFFADAHAGLPPLSPDFFAAGNPFDGTPASTDWTPVGPTRRVGTLEPGVPGVAHWEWRIPATANRHSCLLLFVTSDEDPLLLAGVTDVGWAVQNDKRVGLKNLHVEDLGAGAASEMIVMEMRAVSKSERTNLILDWGDMPAGTVVRLTTELLGGKRVWRVKDLRKSGFNRKKPTRGDGFPRSIPDRCGGRRFLDRELLEAERGNARRVVLHGVRLPSDRSLAVVFRVELPPGTRPGTYQMDLMQGTLRTPHGGCTYRFRVN